MATPDYTRPKGLLPKPRAKLQRVDITFSQSPTTIWHLWVSAKKTTRFHLELH